MSANYKEIWETLNKVSMDKIKDKKGKYGRYIGVLWVDDLNINELLVEQGHAETREY